MLQVLTMRERGERDARDQLSQLPNASGIDLRERGKKWC
jgi:hypothetical protein